MKFPSWMAQQYPITSIYVSNEFKNVVIKVGKAYDITNKYFIDQEVDGWIGICNYGESAKITTNVLFGRIENYGNNSVIKIVGTIDSLLHSILGEICNKGSNVKIYGGTGNDWIRNFASKITINGGDGHNYIYNSSSDYYQTTDNVIINTGAGNDTVDNSDSDYCTINTGAGDDTISNHTRWNYETQTYEGADNVTINAAGGKNFISLVGGGENISVKGGKRENLIFTNTPENKGTVNPITGEIPDDDNVRGSDLRISFLEGGKSQNLVSIKSSWSHVTVEGGNDAKGIDVILNDGENVLLKGNAGIDYIKNTSDGAVIFGGNHSDIIENYGNCAFIEGDDKDGVGSSKFGDYILTDQGEDATIDGGTGNDLIYLHRFSTYDTNNISWKAAKTLITDILSKYNPFYRRICNITRRDRRRAKYFQSRRYSKHFKRWHNRNSQSSLSGWYSF